MTGATGAISRRVVGTSRHGRNSTIPIVIVEINFEAPLRWPRSPWDVRLAASVFFAVVLVAAVSVMARDPNTWKSPSEQTLGNTAASVETARVAAGTGNRGDAIAVFARETAGPQLRLFAAGTAMPSMGVEP